MSERGSERGRGRGGLYRDGGKWQISQYLSGNNCAVDYMIEILAAKIEYRKRRKPCMQIIENLEFQRLWERAQTCTDWGYETSSRKWNRGSNGLHQLGQPVAPSILFPGRRVMSPVFIAPVSPNPYQSSLRKSTLSLPIMSSSSSAHAWLSRRRERPN